MSEKLNSMWGRCVPISVWVSVLFCLVEAVDVGTDSQSVVSSPTSLLDSPPKRDSGTRGLNPSVVIIVVILTVVFFLSGFLHLLARCCGRVAARREPTDSAMSALHGQLQHLFHLHDSGVDQSFIDTLPVFPYKAICGLKEGTDCAVCLSEFEGEDRLRLLPKCKHAFHLDCIDTWLLSHSTCPLCRCSLLPDEVSPTHANFSDSGRLGSTRSLPSEAAFVGDSRRTTDSRRVLGDDSHALPEHSADSDTDTGKEYDRGIGGESPEIQPVLSREESLRSNTSSVLSVQLGRVGKAGNGGHSIRGRSYSMGSYEYIVDPSNLQVVIAPTPYPGRGNIKADIGRPRHRSVFSDSIPELGSIPGTPSDDMFWATRGLATPEFVGTQHSRMAFTQDSCGPHLKKEAIATNEAGHEYPPRKSSSRSLASLPEVELQDNPLYVQEGREDDEQEVDELDGPELGKSASVQEHDEESRCPSVVSERVLEVDHPPSVELFEIDKEGSVKSDRCSIKSERGSVKSEKSTESKREHGDKDGNVPRRTFSFRFPLGDSRSRVGNSRRTMSETTCLETSSTATNVDGAWVGPVHQSIPQSVNEESTRNGPSIARKTMHWFMGRERRMVLPVFSPSPDARTYNDIENL